ncbi:unnamed protein product [Cuscuta europaea]|uniref:Uncharacterized protein n=1 Tax=Cuscuta europaea TaxID=41803 RepID=A0A9P0ZDV6_CUSEU|nr:unnamed protein product [Cuscuta europaea]
MLVIVQTYSSHLLSFTRLLRGFVTSIKILMRINTFNSPLKLLSLAMTKLLIWLSSIISAIFVLIKANDILGAFVYQRIRQNSEGLTVLAFWMGQTAGISRLVNRGVISSTDSFLLIRPDFICPPIVQCFLLFKGMY